MTVRCPHCSTGYVLPDHLLGPRGARVRCPHCRQAFVVSREGQGETAPLAEPAASQPPPREALPSMEPTLPAPPRPPAPPEAGARELLDALAERLGGRLEAARHQSRVLSELGPELLSAWDEYRDRLGERASSETFRQVLRERWVVDLGPGLPESRPGRG